MLWPDRQQHGGALRWPQALARETTRLVPKRKSGPLCPKCGAGCLFSPQRVGRLHRTNLQPGSQTPGRRQSRAESRMYSHQYPLGCKLTSPVRRLLAGGAGPQPGCLVLRATAGAGASVAEKSYQTPATLPPRTTMWNQNSWQLSLCSWNPRKCNSICPSPLPILQYFLHNLMVFPISETMKVIWGAESFFHICLWCNRSDFRTFF